MTKTRISIANNQFALDELLERMTGELASSPYPNVDIDALMARYRSLETQLAFFPADELRERWILPLMEALGFGLFPNAGQDSAFPDLLLFRDTKALNDHLQHRTIDAAFRRGEAAPVTLCRFNQDFDRVEDRSDCDDFGLSPFLRHLSLESTAEFPGLLTDGFRWRLIRPGRPNAWLEFDSNVSWERRDREGLCSLFRWLEPQRFAGGGSNSYAGLFEKDQKERFNAMEPCGRSAKSAISLLTAGHERSLAQHAPKMKKALLRRVSWRLAQLNVFRLAEGDDGPSFWEQSVHGDLSRVFCWEDWPEEAFVPEEALATAAHSCFESEFWRIYRRFDSEERFLFWETLMESSPTESEEALGFFGLSEGQPRWGAVEKGSPQPATLKKGSLFYTSNPAEFPIDRQRFDRLKRYSAEVVREGVARHLPLLEELESLRSQSVGAKGISKRQAVHAYQEAKKEALEKVIRFSWMHWFCGCGLGMYWVGLRLASQVGGRLSPPTQQESDANPFLTLLAIFLQRSVYGVEDNPARSEIARRLLSQAADGADPNEINIACGHPLLGAHPSRLADPNPKPATLATRFYRQGSFVEYEFQSSIGSILSDFQALNALEAGVADPSNADSARKRLGKLSGRFLTLADAWLSVQTDKEDPTEAYTILLNRLKSPQPEWDAALAPFNERLKEARLQGFVHIPLVFPERFFGGKGDRPPVGFSRILLEEARPPRSPKVKQFFNKLRRYHQARAKSVPIAQWIWLHRFYELLDADGVADWFAEAETAEVFTSAFGREEVASPREESALEGLPLSEVHRPDPLPEPDFKPVLKLYDRLNKA